MADNAARLLDWCSHSSYKAPYLAAHLPLTHPRQLANRGRCHLLLQPAGRPWPSWAMMVENGAPVDKAKRRLAE